MLLGYSVPAHHLRVHTGGPCGCVMPQKEEEEEGTSIFLPTFFSARVRCCCCWLWRLLLLLSERRVEERKESRKYRSSRTVAKGGRERGERERSWNLYLPQGHKKLAVSLCWRGGKGEAGGSKYKCKAKFWQKKIQGQKNLQLVNLREVLSNNF